MSYYQFNRQKILQKAKKNYSNGKAAKYYIANKEASKKKDKKQVQKYDRQKKKQAQKEYQKNITRN